MKRLIRFVFLLLAFLPITAVAQWNCWDYFEKDGIYYGLDYQFYPSDNLHDGCVVLSIDTSINSNIVIPDSVNIGNDNHTIFYPVTAIALNTYQQNHSGDNIPGTDFSHLTNITLPRTIKHINAGSFIGASNLNVNITDLEAWCDISYILIEQIQNFWSYDYRLSSSPGFEDYQLYLNGEKLTNLTFPNTLTHINPYVFSGCLSLTNVTIPNSVTSIGEGAYKNCTNLTNISIPNSVTSIGERAFSDCTGLTNISIPNSVTSLGERAFSDCTGLTNISIPNSVTSIGEGAFSDCTGLTNISIPNSVTSLGGGAFMGCTGFTDFTIPNSVTSIGTGLFAFCTGLNTINVEQGNPIYDSRDNCNAVINTSDNELIAACKNTIIPNTVTSIKGMDEFFLGGAYSYGGYGSFEGIDMDHIVIPSTVTQIGHGAFGGSYIKKIYYNPVDCISDLFEDPFYYRYCYPFSGCRTDEFIIGGNVSSVVASGAYISNLIIPSYVYLYGNDYSNISNVYLVGNGYRCDIESCELSGANLHIAGFTSIGRIDNFSNIYCYDTTPPQCTDDSFGEYSAMLHVPATSLASYFSAPYWSNFANIIGDLVGQNPNSVTLSEDTIEMKTGKSFHLNATVDPMETYNDSFLIWRSSDMAIATVVNGEVLALSEGECDITASYLGKQAICHVSVVNSLSLSLDQTEVTLEPEKSITLRASIVPESEAANTIIWSSSDKYVAIVHNGIVTAINEGVCDITASCLGVKAVCHVMVTGPRVTIMLDQQEAMVLPNHIITLTPSASTSLPELAVTSSDPTVAAVRLMSGKVQVVGVKEGTSTITVGSADGTAVPATCLVTVYTESGDANCDGFVNISDVTAIINFILNDDPSGIKLDNADYNGDGEANISDVIDLINRILNTND